MERLKNTALPDVIRKIMRQRIALHFSKVKCPPTTEISEPLFEDAAKELPSPWERGRFMPRWGLYRLDTGPSQARQLMS
jgi:hypothetical protein